MSELISILVPVYNVQEHLHKCINSIINQTYKNLEIILVDDGSTDRSGIICDEFQKKDPRIKVIHKKNGGLASTRKAAIEICTGAYIGFVDSDDWIEQEMYSYLLDNLVYYDVDIIECGIRNYFNGYETITTCIKGGLLKNTEEGKDCTHTDMFLYNDNNVNHISPSVCNKLFKADLVKKYYKTIPEINFGEDSAFVYKCLSKIRSMYVSKKTLYCYNKANASAMTVQPDIEKNIIDITKMYMFLKKDFLLHEQRENLLYQLDRYFLNVIFLCLPKSLYTKINRYSYDGTFDSSEKIVIYGAGSVGECYINQLKSKIVGVFDKNQKNKELYGFTVEPPEKISNTKYDKILIAVLNEELAVQIKKELVEKHNIASNKILWKKPVYILQKIFL